MNTIVPKKFHSLIKFSKLVLTKSSDITYNDVSLVKNIIQEKLNNGMSPNEIKKFYNIDYSDFGMFLKKSLGLQLKSNRDANINTAIKNGSRITNLKLIYKQNCNFNFDPYAYPDIPNYNLLLTHGMYHPVNNPKGVSRDHMVSKEYGWRNNIDASIISSIYNCQFLLQSENSKKNDKSCITIDDLLDRIQNNTFVNNKNTAISLPKSESHKKKISNTNSKFMVITNGSVNKRVLKTSVIPTGFRKGFTRRSKMVDSPGLEPRSSIF